MKSKWEVRIENKARKQVKNLPLTIQKVFFRLVRLLEDGPIKSDWPNFGRLQTKKNVIHYHCHLQKGNPTYVSCWSVDKIKKIISVYYVGTHEKAPY